MDQHQKTVGDPMKSGSPNEGGSEHLDSLPLEEQMSELAALAMIGRITPEVIHDINNQLTGILGYAELLMMKKVEDPGIANGLKNILLSAEKCKVLLDNLLVLSRQETGPIRIAQVNEVIEKTLELTSCALRHRQIECIRELGRDIPAIPLEVAPLQKTILNLILKAEEVLEHQPQDRRLRVETAFIPQAQEVVIKVSDNVSGTPATRCIPLSERDQKSLSPDLGIRLGLIDAIRWIGDLGGSIEVEGVEGKGTTFTLHWPVKGNLSR
jgi:two-component system NtrC family sensor kinase